jgi:hypothetical protein
MGEGTVFSGATVSGPISVSLPSPPPEGDVFDGSTEQSSNGGTGDLGTGGTLAPPRPAPPTPIPPDPNVLVLTTAPSAALGQYDFYDQLNIASGGIPPYSYSIVGGAIPNGTAFYSSDGQVGNAAQVRGTLLDNGPFSYTVQAQDSTGLLTFTTIGGGTYSGSGAYPGDAVAGSITTPAANQLVMIVCITGRDNTTLDTNAVTDIVTSGGLTFTRAFHDASFTYTDSSGDASFPVASYSIDIFTAPAPSQITSPIFWHGTMSGSFVNHGTAFVLSIGGLNSLSSPFDPMTPNVASNTSGTTSTPSNTGVTTTNANDALLSLIINHGPTSDVAPVPPTGFIQIANKDNPGGASGFSLLLSYLSETTIQSAITLTAGFSDHYWYSAIFALEGGGGTPLTAQQTVTGNISTVVPGTTTIDLSTPNTNNPGSQPVFLVPPYNTLTVEVYGGSLTGTTLKSTYGLDLSVGVNGHAIYTFTPATPGAPPENGGAMPYTIGTGSPAGEIIFSWV